MRARQRPTAPGSGTSSGDIPARSIKNVRATNTGCTTARTVARAVQREGRSTGYTCRHRGASPASVTCVRGARKVTFTLTGSFALPQYPAPALPNS